LGGVSEGWLSSSVGEQAGDELVGQFAESQVDLGFQSREGGGIACQLLGPKGLLGSQVGMNEFEGLGRRWDRGTRLGVEADTHGKSFQVKPYLLE
jgi:hypothetical protein